MQSGAGECAGLPDRSFGQVTLMADPQLLVRQADVVLRRQGLGRVRAKRMKEGAVLVSFIYEYREPELVAACGAQSHLFCHGGGAPRVAQAMDALSAQASLARAIAVAPLGATHLARVMPRMTTAAASSPRPGAGDRAGRGRAAGGCHRASPSAPPSRI